MKGEGHYLALLKKGSEGCENTETNPKRQKKQTVPGSAGGLKKIPEELEEFLGHLTLPLDPSRLDLKKERVYYCLLYTSFGGDISQFVPEAVAAALEQKMNKRRV